MMRPKVTKRERKLHLSYELPHRVHCAAIYPIAAPNASQLILFAHDQGLRILWRGGRRPRESQQPVGSEYASDKPDDELETEEEEQDHDCPYPSIVQALDINLGRDVLHLAVPSLSSSALLPQSLMRTAIVALALADGAVRLLQIPMTPPTNMATEITLQEIKSAAIELVAKGTVPSSLAVKFLPKDNQIPVAPRDQDQNGVEGELLVAAASRNLSVWTIKLGGDELLSDDSQRLQHLLLEAPVTSLAFHPLARSAQLLLVHNGGAARIYDPCAVGNLAQQLASTNARMDSSTNRSELGKWVMSYLTPFQASKDPTAYSALARRKGILDAKWILAGKVILALLEDGQWGMWDVAGLNHPPGKGPKDFVLDGFLESAGSGELAEPTRLKKGLSKLAPMTPNTRKTKTEELFKPASKSLNIPPRGGISVAMNNSRTGQADESAVLHYNSDVYSIASTHNFWQRSTTNNGGGFGSLYAPGLVHITDIDLINENISSISHFSSKSSGSGLGQMNTQRDLLVAAERRAVILHHVQPPTPSSRMLLQLAERPVSIIRDQQMLDSQSLPLDGIDRMLDNIGNGTTAAKSVGFAIQ